MGLFDLFGKSFADQVQEAINTIGSTTPGVSGLDADIRGKVVTLKGDAESREAAAAVPATLRKLLRLSDII